MKVGTYHKNVSIANNNTQLQLIFFALICVAACSASSIGVRSLAGGSGVLQPFPQQQQQPQFESIPDIQYLPIDDIETIRRIRNEASEEFETSSDDSFSGYVGGGGAGFGGPTETHKSVKIFDRLERSNRLLDSYGVPITNSGYN